MKELLLDHEGATFTSDATSWHKTYLRPNQLGLLAVFSRPSIPGRGFNPTFGDEIRWRLARSFEADVRNKDTLEQLREHLGKIALQPSGEPDLDDGKTKEKFGGLDLSGNIDIKFALTSRLRNGLLGFAAISSIEEQAEPWTPGDELRARLDRSFIENVTRPVPSLLQGRYNPYDKTLTMGNSSVALTYGLPEVDS